MIILTSCGNFIQSLRMISYVVFGIQFSKISGQLIIIIINIIKTFKKTKFSFN